MDKSKRRGFGWAWWALVLLFVFNVRAAWGEWRGRKAYVSMWVERWPLVVVLAVLGALSVACASPVEPDRRCFVMTGVTRTDTATYGGVPTEVGCHGFKQGGI